MSLEESPACRCRVQLCCCLVVKLHAHTFYRLAVCKQCSGFYKSANGAHPHLVPWRQSGSMFHWCGVTETLQSIYTQEEDQIKQKKSREVKCFSGPTEAVTRSSLPDCSNAHHSCFPCSSWADPATNKKKKKKVRKRPPRTYARTRCFALVSRGCALVGRQEGLWLLHIYKYNLLW